MIGKIKYWVLFSLLLLPLAAFADFAGSVHFFTPPPGDYSISLLERTFGAVGNLLNGRGNQIVGIVLGMFNAFWVIGVGIGVLFVMWDAVLNAAHSGDMMGGKGKKTVFIILRIVIGFSLVVPSKTTGYSLAQNMVIWVVMQGVGLADRVNKELYNYTYVGGEVFTHKPSSGAEITAVMPPTADVLRAGICMYKLRDVIMQQNQSNATALSGMNEGTGVTGISSDSSASEIGYSVNVRGAEGSVTFGSLNANYDPEQPNSTRYNNECGQVNWRAEMNLNASSPVEAAAMRKVLGTYMQTGVTEMVLNLLPVAKEISLVDPNASGSNSKFAIISKSGSVTMAGSGISYATLIDPVRRSTQMYIAQEMQKSLSRLHVKGWIFTPIMVMLPATTDIDQISVEKYLPASTPPDLSNPQGILKTISSSDLNTIQQLVDRVQVDDYIGKASTALKIYDQNNSWQSFNMGDPNADNKEGKGIYAGNPDYHFLGLNLAASSAEVALYGIGKFAGGFIDIAKFPLMGVNVLISGVNEVLDFFDLGSIKTGPVDSALAALSAVQTSIDDTMRSAGGSFRNIINTTYDTHYLQMATKGGLSRELVNKTEDLGPLGPVFAMISTSMIGTTITSFEENLYSGNSNALVGVMRIGKSMIVSAIDSSFLFGKIIMYWYGGVQALEQLSAIPYIGPVFGAIGGMGKTAFPLAMGFGMMHITLALMMISCGLILYIMVPLTFIVTFSAVCLRWIGMVFVNVLAAPVFCFNLIRTDSDGLIGKGEGFLTDLAKTVLMPAILTIGAIIFLILFNIGYLLVASIFSEFISILSQVNSPLIVPLTLVALLMIFSITMLHIATSLSNLCTVEFVNSVGQAIGHGFQQLHEQSPAQEMRHAVMGTGQQAGQLAQKPIVGGGMPSELKFKEEEKPKGGGKGKK